MHLYNELYLSQYIYLGINYYKPGNTSFVVPLGLGGNLASLIWDDQKRIPLNYLNVPYQLLVKNRSCGRTETFSLSSQGTLKGAEGNTMAIVCQEGDRDTRTTEVGNWLPHYRPGEAFDFLRLLKSVYSYSAQALRPSISECSREQHRDLLCGFVFMRVTWGSSSVFPDCCPSLLPSLLPG